MIDHRQASTDAIENGHRGARRPAAPFSNCPASRNAPSEGPRNACGMGVRCLIVDDSPRFLEAAQALLEREGFAVVGVASTGTEALRRIQDVKPDVALVDVDLGTESGFDLARRIHNETSRDSSRIILISTYAEDDFAELIAASPVAGFLSKSRLSARAIREILDDTDDANVPRGT